MNNRRTRLIPGCIGVGLPALPEIHYSASTAASVPWVFSEASEAPKGPRKP